MTAPTAPRLVIEPVGDAYVPGVCNIGPWEIRRRWVGGILGLVIGAALLAALVAVHAPVAARALVLLPVWGGMFSVLQARRRFCGAYAMRRISNFGDTFDTIRQVQDEAAHRADMAKVARMLRDSFLVALAVTVIAVLLPR
jgi:hypothetical protein